MISTSDRIKAQLHRPTPTHRQNLHSHPFLASFNSLSTREDTGRAEGHVSIWESFRPAYQSQEEEQKDEEEDKKEVVEEKEKV